MNRKCREKIDECCDELVPRINLENLWPRLLENKIFNRDDVNIPRWTKSLTDERTVRDVYLTIKTRGPLAFDRFVLSLRQSGHDDLADKLEGKRSSLNNNDVILNVTNTTPMLNNNDTLPQFTNTMTIPVSDTVSEQKEVTPAAEWQQDDFFCKLQLSEKPLQIKVRKSTAFLDDASYESVQRYPMRSKPRGLVLIITNIQYENSKPRKSAKYDEVNLTELFEQMGFEVVSFRDLTSKELFNRIQEFAKRKDLRKVDSCFVIISSHGRINAKNECTEIEAVDYHIPNPEDKTKNRQTNYQTILCSDLVECFTAKACPQLAGKPKVFIFQLCRGQRTQLEVKEPRHTRDASQLNEPETIENSTAPCNPISTRPYADMFIVYATTYGHVAFRDRYIGSWFIQILCEVFMNYACCTHLQDMFIMIDERLQSQRTEAGECQTSVITSMGFNKHCYLNPGLFEDT